MGENSFEQKTEGWPRFESWEEVKKALEFPDGLALFLKLKNFSIFDKDEVFNQTGLNELNSFSKFHFEVVFEEEGNEKKIWVVGTAILSNGETFVFKGIPEGFESTFKQALESFLDVKLRESGGNGERKRV